MHSHFSRDGGQDFMSVFKFNLKHSIGQCFRNSAILFNKCLFRHTFWVRKDMGMAAHYENPSMISMVFIKILQVDGASGRYRLFGIGYRVLIETNIVLKTSALIKDQERWG